GAVAVAPPRKESRALALGHPAIEPFQRSKQAQGRMAPVPGVQQAVGEGHQGCLAASDSMVVMRRWLKPSLPAASMAVITDWWAVRASAGITSGRLLSPSDSRPRAEIRVVRSLFTRFWPWSEYWPSAAMLSSRVFSGVSSG